MGWIFVKPFYFTPLILVLERHGESFLKSPQILGLGFTMNSVVYIEE